MGEGRGTIPIPSLFHHMFQRNRSILNIWYSMIDIRQICGASDTVVNKALKPMESIQDKTVLFMSRPCPFFWELSCISAMKNVLLVENSVNKWSTCTLSTSNSSATLSREHNSRGEVFKDAFEVYRTHQSIMTINTAVIGLNESHRERYHFQPTLNSKINADIMRNRTNGGENIRSSPPNCESFV